MKIIIDVTQDDIDKGTKHDVQFCPIARALRRSAPELHEIAVGIFYADGRIIKPRTLSNLLRNKSSYVYAKLPSDALDFVTLFDMGEKVEPQKFELEFKDWA